MGLQIRPPGFRGTMPPLNSVLEAEDQAEESNRMQEDEIEEKGSKGNAKGEGNLKEEWGKPKWKKGKKASWEENQEKGMSSWKEHGVAEEHAEYEKE
eukprot:955080-Karenia_brevis.AAC.1